MSIATHLYETNDGLYIAELCFDNAEALNAQTPAMTKAARKQIKRWAKDVTIRAVVLRGAGDKAFCAGGDIKKLYRAALKKNAVKIDKFFSSEYDLIAEISRQHMPVIAWGNGIVMGGGLGILAAARHKVATQSTIMAMPEVSIGLFPDAGATHFLPKLAGHMGLFLGLTGARVSGYDAYGLGLADVVTDCSYETFIENLRAANWRTSDSHGEVSAVLARLHRPKQPAIFDDFDTINALMSGTITQINTNLRQYSGDSAFICNAIDHYKKGSSITKAFAYYLYRYGQGRSLTECLELERSMAMMVCQNGDFAEGVRALLIDKDKTPQWKYDDSQLADINLRDILIPTAT